MRDLIIYGAGGFGRETALLASQINSVRPTWKLVGFCDDSLKKHDKVFGLPVIGGISELNNFASDVSVVIAVADPAIRKNIRIGIENSRVSFPVLVHPSAMMGDPETNRVEEGSIVTAGNIFTTNIHIKSFAIVNLSCTIGHDVVIGDYCSIMPGCSISGSVNLAEGSLVGSGARILPGIRIGKSSRVGAGAVVTHDVEDNITVVGIPARPVRK